jgi:F1F0 ATPase subunit 2
MNEAVALTLAALAGGALGMIFFGGLWWTVRRGATSEQPALWFFCSLSLRMCIVLAGVYLVAGADWQRLLLCLLGFTAARVIVTRWTRAMEVSRAPQS